MIFFSQGSSCNSVLCCAELLSCVQLFVTPRTNCSPPGSSVHGDSLGKNTEVGCHALSPGALPNPGIKPVSPALQADSLPSELPGKPSCNSSGPFNSLGPGKHIAYKDPGHM